MPSTQVQRRRGTTVEHTTFTGALGEITIDTTKKTAVVHDGATAGGFPLVKEASAGVANGVASLDGTGKVPIAQLPIGTSDLLSALAQAEVSITGAVVLTGTALGRMHICTGTTVDYTVTLPTAVGNAGKFIGIRMSVLLTKLVTLDGNAAETIDGSATRLMWKNESAFLMSDGAEWIKVMGRSLPMGSTMERPALSSSFSSTATIVDMSATVFDNGGMANLTTDAITIRRPGQYILRYNAVFFSAINASSKNSMVYKNAVNIEAAAPDAGGRLCCDTAITTLALNDAIELRVRNLAASDQVSGSYLTLIEIPSW